MINIKQIVGSKVCGVLLSIQDDPGAHLAYLIIQWLKKSVIYSTVIASVPTEIILCGIRLHYFRAIGSYSPEGSVI